MKAFFVTINLLVLLSSGVFGAFRSTNKIYENAHEMPDVYVPRMLPGAVRSWNIGRSAVRFVGPSQRSSVFGLRWISDEDLD